MRGWRITAVVLFILLLASNAWWFYAAIDTAVTQSFQDQMLSEWKETAHALAAILPAVAQGENRDKIVATAEGLTRQKAFEKDGATWVGVVGLVFDDKGTLVRVRTIGEPEEGTVSANHGLHVPRPAPPRDQGVRR